jgi:hypothetical protein
VRRLISPESPLRIEFLAFQAFLCGEILEELPMSGLHDAAAALLQEAPEPVVLTVIRLLLDARAPTPARTPEVRPLPVPRPALPSRAKPAVAAPIDENWEELRRQVRTVMAERGASFEDVATAIARSAIGVRIMLGSRKPPKRIVRARLQAWLDEQPAPAVAVAPIPFPGAGTEHRGNGRLVDAAREYADAYARAGSSAV